MQCLSILFSVCNTDMIEPLQVCAGEEDAAALKGVWPVLNSVTALVLKGVSPEDNDFKQRREFVKECISGMQAAKLLRSAQEKLHSYGRDAADRTKKDATTGMALMKTILLNQHGLTKTLKKLQTIRTMFSDFEEGDVLGFDMSKMQKFEKNPEWVECVTFLAKESQTLLESLVKDMTAASAGYGASSANSWEAGPEGGGVAGSATSCRADHSDAGRLQESQPVQHFPEGPLVGPQILKSPKLHIEDRFVLGSGTSSHDPYLSVPPSSREPYPSVFPALEP